MTAEMKYSIVRLEDKVQEIPQKAEKKKKEYRIQK